MQNITISFIGAGNMARSLIGGLIAAGFSAKHIWATNPIRSLLTQLKNEFNIHITTDNKEAAAIADVIVLCVKPKEVAPLCAELKTSLTHRGALIISIAAGITIDSITQWLGKSLPIVRTMPNTPALVQAGITGLFANTNVTPTQHQWAEQILRAVGSIAWVKEESQLDAVTALSGSGPAYFLLFMEELAKAGQQLGLSAEEAHLLVMQTALGTAKLAVESNESWENLRKKITSPGGTTEQALNVFSTALPNLCEKAVQAAYHRAKELSTSK